MVGGGWLTYRYGPTRTVASAPTTVTVTAAPTAAPLPGAQPTPNPATPTGVPPLYLSQVQEVSSSYELLKQGFGINGTFYPLSINVNTPITSDPYAVDYLLNRQYRTFATVFGVADDYSELGNSDTTPATCTLQILLDGRPVAPLQTATRETPVTLTNLDMSGGTRLRLVVNQSGSSGNASPYPCTLGNPMVAG